MNQRPIHATLIVASLCALASCTRSTEPSTKPQPTSEASAKPQPTAVATAEPQPAFAAGVNVPKAIPLGYHFPGERAQIQAWADAWEIDKITAKAWNL